MLIPLIQNISYTLEINVIAVEYPGYSLYKSKKVNKENIKNDSLDIIYFLNNVCNIKNKNIILMGRSIGTGPVIYLSSLF